MAKALNVVFLGQNYDSFSYNGEFLTSFLDFCTLAERETS